MSLLNFVLLRQMLSNELFLYENVKKCVKSIFHKNFYRLSKGLKNEKNAGKSAIGAYTDTASFF